MFVIGEITVEEAVAEAQFSCDLRRCKGACCTLPGGRGAPLEDDEVSAVEEAVRYAATYLSPEHLAHIRMHGAIEGAPGSYATQCNDDRDCVFVYHEEGIARCSIEKAYFDGAGTFRKPVSCHLFPIRVTPGAKGRLRYERIPECDPGRSQGRNAKTPLHVFLKEALVRKFGDRWYDEFASSCEQRNGTR
jgi:hypothetical protein